MPPDELAHKDKELSRILPGAAGRDPLVAVVPGPVRHAGPGEAFRVLQPRGRLRHG